MIVHYSAINRLGIPFMGQADVDDLCGWVERQFDRGFRSLEAWPAREWLSGQRPDGVDPVAGIVRHPDTGQRTWWSDREVTP